MSEPTNAEAFWPSLDEARQALRSGTGKGVKVAIIDSGIEVDHPGLNGIELADDVAISCDGMRLLIGEGGGRDVFGHGTAVAGILKEAAPDVEIGSFRALDSRNHSRSLAIAECARQAIDRGYQIINCSFGCRGLPKYVMEYKEWIDAAHVAGVSIVAASSNVSTSVREWPAYFPSVISVGVADCAEEDLISEEGEMVAFSAKGERVKVPWMEGTWRLETGSSFAAPRVAGMIARLLSVSPKITAEMMKPLLKALSV